MKPIIILCAGPSIKDLSSNIESFRNINVPYLLINGYEKVYKDTFGSINKYPLYVSVYADKHSRMSMKTEKDFISHGTKLLTPKVSYNTKIRERNPEYTLLDPDYDGDKPLNHTNSLIKVVVYLASVGYDTMFVYGCDGHKENEWTHYEENKSNDVCNRIRDTKDINNRMQGILEEIEFKGKIYNCCPASVQTCFPIITVEKSIEILNEL